MSRTCGTVATPAASTCLPSYCTPVPGRDGPVFYLFDTRWHHPVPALRSPLTPDCDKMSTMCYIACLVGLNAADSQISSISVGCQKACFCLVLSRHGPPRPQARLRNISRLGKHGLAGRVAAKAKVGGVRSQASPALLAKCGGSNGVPRMAGPLKP